MDKQKKKPFIEITLDDSELEDADKKIDDEIKTEMEVLGIKTEQEYAKYLDNKLKSEAPELYKEMKKYFETGTE